MPFFKSRTAKHRTKMKHEGMRSISVWVPISDAEWLRTLFSRIGENTLEGISFRQFVNPFIWRRRPPGRQYKSTYLQMEIDGLNVGVGNEIAPIGGRIFNHSDTLKELSPEESRDLENDIQNEIGKVINHFIKKNALEGKIDNNASVITDEHFLRKEPLVVVDDYTFKQREILSTHNFVEKCYFHGEEIIKDKSIYKYLGYFNVPSRCQVIEDELDEGKIIIALIAVPNGGTAPYLIREKLCEEIKNTRYPDKSSNDIIWIYGYPEEINMLNGYTGKNEFITETWEMFAPFVRQMSLDNSEDFDPSITSWTDLPTSTKNKIKKAIYGRIEQESQTYFNFLHKKRTEANQPVPIFLMPKEIREMYGKFHVDIKIDDTSDTKLIVALIQAAPSGIKGEKEPLLAFSKPGTLDFRSEPELSNLKKKFPCFDKLLQKNDYGWDDPDFKECCEAVGINWRKAKKSYAG
ncbi:antitoxin MazE-like protein [Kiloniella sp.]|uniref:antitoxin MazE-like protein n=1 Tax=Kiloniella sp. TaxID=1938587 RepID=UPI003B029986